MISRRRELERGKLSLAEKGLAVVLEPPGCLLDAGGCVVVKLGCFNNMCGEYSDVMRVQVGACVWGEVVVYIWIPHHGPTC